MIKLGFYMGVLDAIGTKSGSNITDHYRSWDLLISIIIIGILSIIAINIFMGYKKQALLIHCLGEEASIRRQSQVYYSIKGVWPENSHEIETLTGISGQDTQMDHKYIASVQLNNGAVHVLFKNDLDGKTLTLRPAVPREDPTGPVIWVAGTNINRESWTLFGPDNTTVEPGLINWFLK